MTATVPELPRTVGGRVHGMLVDAGTVAWRDLIHWRRDPARIWGSLLYTVISVLLFGYVFGSAMSVPGGGNYREFLMPGMFAMTMMFGIGETATGVATDAAKGVAADTSPGGAPPTTGAPPGTLACRGGVRWPREVEVEMGKAGAAASSAVFFVLAPGVVAGLVPWWLTGWRVRDPFPWWMPLRVVGVAVLLAGAAVLVHAFVRFVVEGIGTPAPVAPTRELVVGGLYRYVRNPMYLAVLAAIVGQALALGQLGLLAYAAGVAAAFVVFVHWYEEPTLARQFGARYQAYRRAVPGWWPRRHPWTSHGGR